MSDSGQTADRRAVAALRSAAQLLHRPPAMRHPADVARAICGVQAQEPYAARLAFRSRSARLTAADVDRARTEERSLLRTWAMRGTLHLLATEDARWLVPLFERSMADNSSMRLAQLGLDARAQERALREIERALAADGPLSRAALSQRLERKRIALDPSRSLHVFRLATARGIACAGPDEGGRTSLALERDWLGPRPAHDRDAALAELARRYLRAFAPATDADFAGWSGLGLREVRAGLAAIAGELVEVAVGDQTMLRLKGRAPRAKPGTVRLLPGWDTYLMGHRDRHYLAEPADWRRILVGGGVLRPTIVRDGVAVGTWSMPRGRGELRVEIEPFGELDKATLQAIEAEVADVGRFEAAPAALAAPA